MVAGDRKKLHQFIRAVVCDEICDELLKRCRKVVDVEERDLAKMEQVKKAVLDRVVIGYLMSRIVLQSM